MIDYSIPPSQRPRVGLTPDERAMIERFVNYAINTHNDDHILCWRHHNLVRYEDCAGSKQDVQASLHGFTRLPGKPEVSPLADLRAGNHAIAA